MKSFADYCTPARLYLAISFASVILIVIQNLMNPNNDSELCIGMYKCTMTNKILLLVFKILYILLWGWFLNLLCKKGLKKLAWFILLIPFLVISIGIGALMLTNTEETYYPHLADRSNAIN